MKEQFQPYHQSSELVKAANNLVKILEIANQTSIVNDFLFTKIIKVEPPEVRKIFDKITRDESKRSLAFMGQLYAHHFTLKEINKLISFYTSPIGKQYIKKAPEILKEILKESTKRMPIILKKLQTQLDKLDKKRESYL